MPRVFFITGTSTGLGHALAQVLLDAGEAVIASARKPTSLSFHNTTPENYLALQLDVTSPTDIDAAFTAALAKFHRIDVLVNNAGYAVAGPFETVSDAQLRQQFETNFFGPVSMTRKALATMREQSPQGGLIMQISSAGGQLGFPMMSAMCASKWAAEGLTEAVHGEVKPEWGIKLMIVEPGAFKTNSLNNMLFGEVEVPSYDHLDGKTMLEWSKGNMIGDPLKAAHVMYELSKMEDPPLRALLGSDSLEAVKGKLKRDRELFARLDLVRLAKSTDF
jgi:NAD(P)-dependent dehydrogenase (short-subunit alcohol dehydrogenase family)